MRPLLLNTMTPQVRFQYNKMLKQAAFYKKRNIQVNKKDMTIKKQLLNNPSTKDVIVRLYNTSFFGIKATN